MIVKLPERKFKGMPAVRSVANLAIYPPSHNNTNSCIMMQNLVKSDLSQLQLPCILALYRYYQKGGVQPVCSTCSEHIVAFSSWNWFNGKLIDGLQVVEKTGFLSMCP
jgi:hypothetical protein